MENVSVRAWQFKTHAHINHQAVNSQHEVTPLQLILVQRTSCELALVQLFEGRLRWSLKNLISVAGQLVMQAVLQRGKN